MRTVAWFSCGVASAVAAKLSIWHDPKTIVVRCVVTNEHPDNDRFSDECEKWFGRPILKLQSEKYSDCWDVWQKRRYLNGPGGALCTVEMKKKVRQLFQRPDDVQVFGYTSDEEKRALIFRENNLEVTPRFPLIEVGLDKMFCFKVMMDLGIQIPIMYRLGYGNANCIGCVKGGAGYWNKIRVDFPETFERMAKLERHLDASCINGKFLDKLDPKAGRHKSIALPECGIACTGG